MFRVSLVEMLGVSLLGGRCDLRADGKALPYP